MRGSRIVPALLAASALLLAAAALARADDSAPLTLQQCVDYAYAHNRALQSARAGVGMRDAQVRQAVSTFLPSAAIDGFVTHYGSAPNQSVILPPDFQQLLEANNVSGNLTFATTPQTAQDYRVTVSEPLFTSGKLYTALEIRRGERAVAALDETAAKADVGLAVVRAFNEVLLAEETVAAQEEIVRLAETIVTDARHRHERGSASALDLQQADADFATAQLPVLQARNELPYRINSLKRVIGWALDQPLAVRGELAFRPRSTDTAELVHSALQQRADIRELDELVQVRERQLQSVMLTTTPTVSLTGAYEFYQKQRLDLPPQVLSGGLVLSWPLFEGLSLSAKLDEARLAREQAAIQRDERRAALQLDVEKAVADLEVTEAGCRAHHSVLEAARERVRTAEEGFALGHISRIDLARERHALLMARLDDAQARFDHVVTKARLNYLIGAPPEDL